MRAFQPRREPLLGALAAVATFAVVSGGLHLDGLADTADALLAPTPVAAERAREDPAVGPGGVVAIVVVLACQVVALGSVTASTGPLVGGAVVIVGGSVSRWLPVLAVVALRRRLGPDGLGAWFAARVSVGTAAVGGVTAVVVTGVAAALAGPAIAIAAAGGLLVGIAGTALIVRARGRLDGDGLGASVEIALTATLVGLAVIVR